MPGHAMAAIAAYPELGNTGQHLDVLTYWGITEHGLGVGDNVLRFFEDVLEEVLTLFPSPFIHIGGDECPKTEWRESPAAQARMKSEGLRDEDELQSWFIRHFDTWLAQRGRRLVGWDEILEGGLAPGATVMSWRGESGGIAAAKLGHDVVMAPEKPTYLDHSQTELPTEPPGIGGHNSLEDVYAYHPVPKELSDGEAQPPGRAELFRITVLTGLDRCVLALRLEVRELPVEDFREGRIVVDRFDVARELHGGVVARRHSVLVLIPVAGDVGVGAEDREERAWSLLDRLPDRVDAREMEEHGLIAVPDEVSRHDDRKVARRRAGDDEVAEVVCLEEVAPLRVGERLVVPVDQHQVNDERSGWPVSNRRASASQKPRSTN